MSHHFYTQIGHESGIQVEKMFGKLVDKYPQRGVQAGEEGFALGCLQEMQQKGEGVFYEGIGRLYVLQILFEIVDEEFEGIQYDHIGFHAEVAFLEERRRGEEEKEGR